MPTKNDLLLAMTGHASTNKWDIVCCCNADIINNILKEKYRRQWTVAAEVKLKGSYEDPFRGEIMLDADLVLHEPELQFIAGTSNVCRLSMPIVSFSCKLTPQSDPGKAESYTINPNVLQVVADFPPAAVSGDTEEVHDGTQPVVFKDSTITTQQIFLHFKNVPETTFNIVPVPSEEEDAQKQVTYQENIQPEIIMLIAGFFKEKVSEIDYPVGGISNTVETDVITIHPKSFIFSLSAPDQKTPDNSSARCLNLYIQSAESGNPPGDANPSFQPAGNTISPVPVGYTASLILSVDFMRKLLASMLSDREAKPCPDTDGLSIQINFPKIIPVPGRHISDVEYFEGFTVPNTPMTLTFSQDKLNVTLASSSSGKYSKPLFINVEQTGTLTAVLEVKETFDLKLAPDGMLQFNFTLNQSGIKVDVKDSDAEVFYKIPLDAMKNQISSFIGSPSVSMNRVDMLAVSNLLFPDQNKLNFAGGDSFYVPHDLIVFGNIK